MTDYPALCVNPNCRPDPGPRQARTNSNLCDTCRDRLAENLTAIADVWPDLLDRLGKEGGSALTEKVKGTKNHELVLNEKVSDTMRSITSWAWFLARVVMDEKEPKTGPIDGSTDEALRWVAKWHCDHFANHHDAELAASTAGDAWDLLRKARRAAYPSGARRVDLPNLRCVEHTVNAEGERTPCDGTMFAIAHPQATYEPDLICSEDDTHRIAPAVWRRIGWAQRIHPKGAANLAHRLAQ